MRLLMLLPIAMLAGCGGPGLSDRQRDEVADLATDGGVDPDEVAALGRRIDELETQVEQLQSDLSGHDSHSSDISDLQGRVSQVESDAIMRY